MNKQENDFVFNEIPVSLQTSDFVLCQQTCPFCTSDSRWTLMIVREDFACREEWYLGHNSEDECSKVLDYFGFILSIWRGKGDFTARFIMWWGDYNDRPYKQITVTLGSGMCLVSFSAIVLSSEPCDWKLNESQRIIVLAWTTSSEPFCPLLSWTWYVTPDAISNTDGFSLPHPWGMVLFSLSLEACLYVIVRKRGSEIRWSWGATACLACLHCIWLIWELI